MRTAAAAVKFNDARDITLSSDRSGVSRDHGSTSFVRFIVTHFPWPPLRRMKSGSSIR
jgi:hypothetical protein